MPNRIIKESICTSDTIDFLNAEEERFFYRLIVQADDFGRFDGRAPVVLAGTFPLRVHEIAIEQIEAWLQRLAEVDLIRFYHVEGRRYLYFTTWDKHQQRRAKYSKFPEPPADVVNMKPSDITCNPEQSNVPEESRIREYEESRDETRAPAREKTNSTDSLSSPELSVVMNHYHKKIGMLGPMDYEKLSFWLAEKKMGPDVICVAIDVTAERADNPGVPYIDSVLRNWHNAGVKTVEEARERADPSRRAQPTIDRDADREYLDQVLGVIGDDASASA